MRSPAAAETSSKASARAARVAGGKPAKHGTDSTSERSTTARSYCGLRTRATEAAISSPAVHLAVTFGVVRLGPPRGVVRSAACSGRRSSRTRPSALRARAGWAVRTCTSALVSCGLLSRLTDRHRLWRRDRTVRMRHAEVAVRLGAVAAGDRDVELGIAPHAVLGHVQPGRLDVLLDPDPPKALQRPETAERGGEGEGAYGDEAEGLDAELVERARVDEPAPAGREVLGERRHREQTGGERPPDAGQAVDGDRPDRVVDADPLDERHGDDGGPGRAEADHHPRPCG